MSLKKSIFILVIILTSGTSIVFAGGSTPNISGGITYNGEYIQYHLPPHPSGGIFSDGLVPNTENYAKLFDTSIYVLGNKSISYITNDSNKTLENRKQVIFEFEFIYPYKYAIDAGVYSFVENITPLSEMKIPEGVIEKAIDDNTPKNNSGYISLYQPGIIKPSEITGEEVKDIYTKLITAIQYIDVSRISGFDNYIQVLKDDNIIPSKLIVQPGIVEVPFGVTITPLGHKLLVGIMENGDPYLEMFSVANELLMHQSDYGVNLTEPSFDLNELREAYSKGE